MRKALADKYIRGRGIEVGGLHCPLPVPPGALVSYVDRMSLESLKASSDVKPVENEIIVDDAERLDHFEDGTLDFVIANHVFEHCRDAIGTMRNWMRVLRPGGIVYAAIPEKTQTFDRKRQSTKLQHLIDEYNFGPENYDATHYREYLFNVDDLREEQLEQRIVACLASAANIHFHCWDRPAQHEMMNYMSDSLGFKILEAADHGAEIIWVLRK